MSSINFYFFSSLPFCHPIFPHLCFLSQTEEVIGKGKSEKRNRENTIFSLLFKKSENKMKSQGVFFFLTFKDSRISFNEDEEKRLLLLLCVYVG